jgi:RimJ/RimL family protein N-acetyltransferase
MIAMSADPAQQTWNGAVGLSGRHVRLQALSTGHLPSLRRAVTELDALPYTAMPTAQTLERHVERALEAAAAGSSLPFVVIDTDGDVIGSTRFYDIDRSIPKLTIGYTWYLPRVRRSGVNSECKLLLLGHAFEVLRCQRVAFETSTLNLESRKALAGIGAREEGILRRHKRHPDGSVRDTVVFSIIDSEWPAVKQHLQARLARHEGSIPS